jgi:hypothetical protein
VRGERVLGTWWAVASIVVRQELAIAAPTSSTGVPAGAAGAVEDLLPAGDAGRGEHGFGGLGRDGQKQSVAQGDEPGGLVPRVVEQTWKSGSPPETWA